MLKKCVSIALALVMLLLPMTASAVTWGEIVASLNNTNTYTGGGVTAQRNKDSNSVSVSGGTIEDVIFQFDPNDPDSAPSGSYQFSGVTVAGSVLLIDSAKSGDYQIKFDQDSKITVDNIVMTSSGGTGVLFNEGELSAEQAAIYATNNGTSILLNDGKLSASTIGAGSENGIVSVNNLENGTMNADVNLYAFDGEQTRSSGSVINDGELNGYIYADSSDSARLYVSNLENSTVNGGVYIASTGNSSVNLTNQGTIKTQDDGGYALVLDIYDQSSVSTQSKGNSSVSNGTIENAIVYLNTPDGAKPTQDQINQAFENIDLKHLANNLTTELWTYDDDGNWVARYSIDENGVITLVENLTTAPADSDDDAEPSDEMIRHWMEEKRKEEAVGGVTGSPYVLKQLYLGYHSLDLWLYDSAGQKMYFWEHLSAVGDGTKNLTLRLDTGSTEGMTMRLSQNVLRTLRRAEFSTITLLDADGNLFMQYQVNDLWETFRKYNILPWELLSVGAADAEVMKVCADLTLAPLE